MRTLVLGLALIAALLAAPPASAEIGTIDAVPAATLLLPYFEVDLNDPSGITTLLSINNASATAEVAHVTLWTDQAIPTLGFDIYLTGYDVQTINVRDIFNGVLPVTADAGSDPQDTISPHGPLSQDINFPGGVGPCGSNATVYKIPELNAVLIDHIRKSHTGQLSPVLGGCAGSNYGDGIARGYITVDSVNECNLQFPSNPLYYIFGTAASRNILWGDYFYVDPGQNFAQGDTLVHIESCSDPSVGTGAGLCPFAPGAYTFYGRYVPAAEDQREPLATTFATRYINGGAFTGGTDLVVWRDTKTLPAGASGPHSCALPGPPAWFPLNQTDVVAFDEQENSTDQCFQVDNVAPVTGGALSCFPLAAQRVNTAGGNLIAADMSLASPFGWLFLNLNFAIAGDPFPGVAQAWVSPIMDASGRFSVGFHAIQLDSALTTTGPGFVLIP